MLFQFIWAAAHPSSFSKLTLVPQLLPLVHLQLTHILLWSHSPTLLHSIDGIPKLLWKSMVPFYSNRSSKSLSSIALYSNLKSQLFPSICEVKSHAHLKYFFSNTVSACAFTILVPKGSVSFLLIIFSHRSIDKVPLFFFVLCFHTFLGPLKFLANHPLWSKCVI